jgi:hypothetical protein
MTLILSGTDGLSDVDGSAATPAIRGTDANTGIFFPAADTIAFSEGGTEAMRIDSSGNVGIGTSSPATTLQVTNTSATTNATVTPVTVQAMTSGTAANGFGSSIEFNAEASDGTSYAQTTISSLWTDATAATRSSALTFATRTSAGAVTERARIDSSGNVGIGTSSPTEKITVNGGVAVKGAYSGTSNGGAVNITYNTGTSTGAIYALDPTVAWKTLDISSLTTIFGISGSERARIDSSGNLLVGKTAVNITDAGQVALSTGRIWLTTSANDSLTLNRLTNDGVLAEFRQDSTVEGSISVSGTTVSYNGGHLSRWAQTTTAKDESLVKGTVLSNLDEMNVYTDSEGNPVDNEQLNKVKVSDVEGDVNVAGVFVNWTHDEAHDVDEINMAMTGDMIIRIAEGVTVQRGDLLMSAGDGTAKPQGDDIVRSKTIAKVTSTHVTCTYADGSFCVPCVLMAC